MQRFAAVSGTESLWVLLAAAVAGLLASIVLGVLAAGGPRRRGTVARLLLAAAALFAAVALGCERLGLVDAVQGLRLAALIALAAALIGLVSFIAFDLLLARSGRALPPILRDLVEIVTAVVVTLGLLHAWGFNVLGLVATSAVLTAVVGLALQTTLANLFGGLALQLDRSMAQGEWVRVGSDTGRVLEVGWRATRLVTTDGTTVIVPNGHLAACQVVNLSRPVRAVRHSVEIGLNYRHPPNAVRDALLAAVRDAPGVLAQPAPDCVLVSFAESAIVYALRFWIADLERAAAIDGEVRTRVWYAIRREALDIPFPTRMLLQAEPAPVDDGAEAERLALVGRVTLFAPLGDAERRQVAAAMRRLEFGAGETIARQGEAGDSLYIVERGEVGIYLSVDHATRALATLSKGDVFGEMSLLTGEPRAATCVAHGDVACEVIDRDVFQRVIVANDGIAGVLAAQLAERRVALEASREGLSAATRIRRMEEERSRLLPRIREFFGVS